MRGAAGYSVGSEQLHEVEKQLCMEPILELHKILQEYTAGSNIRVSGKQKIGMMCLWPSPPYSF